MTVRNQPARVVPQVVRVGFLLSCAAIFTIVTVAILSHGTVKDRGSYRAHCASNLHQILIAVATYAAENDGFLPAVTYAPYGLANRGTSRTSVPSADNASAARQELSQALQPGSPLASLRLLMLTNIIKDPRVFVCPVTGHRPSLKPPPGEIFLNFPADNEIDYSLAYPWDSDGAPKKLSSFDRTNVLICDIAPKESASWNGRILDSGLPAADWVSANHPDNEMNVAFSDGHVERVTPRNVFDPRMAETLMVPVRDPITGGL